ncbi:hypothetical protein MRB53_014600 [Persea americana]|uniref:Uncharacterized protein n=1 Tax=Persea americana TaxID=3435 RepID=A0ACC2KB96_PERAE|nr:hypothetical protein MRB53_014600 [Persea americana]
MAPVSLPPGFRFHPTDEELVAYYLKRKINGRTIELEIIPEVDLYKCEPWDLPEKSFLPSKDLEWYFFSPRDRKYPNGSRTNRATQAGYWKATGKDRKVNSQKRAVGMKKTLVYYRGRAPHGRRTDWVMHEYRLEESECEIPSGLQDAYALCRIFKKNGTGLKITEQYGASFDDHSHWTPNDQSSTLELSSEGRGEDLESTCHRFQSETGSSDIIQEVEFDASAQREGKWMHSLADEALSTEPPFQNHRSSAHIPSKVDIALECARLQQRRLLPPLMEDFPQLDLTDSRFLNPGQEDTKETDILQEILSVACASQELMNQSSYQNTWTYNHPLLDEFTPLIELDIQGRNDEAQHHQINDIGSSRFVEISDLEEEFKGQRVVENLRGIKMSHKDLDEIALEEHKTVLIESISNFQREDPDNEGGINEHGTFKGFSDNETRPNSSEYQSNDFTIGFINDNPDGIFHENGDDNDFASTPTFHVYEKVEVSRGLYVSSCNSAKTFFHRVEPSKTVRVHMNTMVTHERVVPKSEILRKNQHRGSVFSKFKLFARDKFMGIKTSVKPWKGSSMINETVTSNISIVALLLTCCIYLGEDLEHEGLRSDVPSNDEALIDEKEDSYYEEVKEMKEFKRMERSAKKKIGLFTNMRGTSISNTFLNWKWTFLFLTVSLALYAFVINKYLLQLKP